MLDKNVPQWLRWAIAAIGMLAAQNALADSVADFYRGKTLSLVVSTTAGTSYDLMGRTLARYLPKHIPGTPAMIVQNMPGADGIVAANYLYSVALKDGTVLAGLQGTVPFEPLLGTKEATFDANKFNWLGSASEETCVLIVRAGVPVDNLQGSRNPVRSRSARRAPTRILPSLRGSSTRSSGQSSSSFSAIPARTTCSWRWSAAKWTAIPAYITARWFLRARIGSRTSR